MALTVGSAPNSPGFVAGVCNPAFADRPSWWDVLCNVETGKISVSKDLKPLPAPAAAQTISLRASRRNVPGSNRAADGADEMGAMGYGDAKAEATDVAFMQEVISVPFSRTSDSGLLLTACHPTGIDPRRDPGTLRRVGHPRPLHRLRPAVRPDRVPLRGRDHLGDDDRVPVRGVQLGGGGCGLRRAGEPGRGSGVCG